MAFPPNKSTDNLVALQNVLYIGEESKTSDLQDLNEVFAKDKKLPFVRKMYLAAFTSLLMALAMGLATGYSSPATYDMTTRPGSPVQPSKDAVSWIGSTLALGAMLGGVCAVTNIRLRILRVCSISLSCYRKQDSFGPAHWMIHILYPFSRLYDATLYSQSN